ncbi:MAG: AbrB/MazE/SpoVT family DNA-binding domain-containing protein [Deltaproteobacteria bacterium]|nr:AbrB/MazE/SpoVT family DNA-binding domain-containing protein [Deltaproteobacteria bacterium]MBW1833357.1 AbrB/MazE/SpoVT family DNA-binding domain-containing protein [Deltaproteobacteria bacterium]MBW2165377.1 AbrB/MazE/SpoVT family DNA-binding domain-containing protein [Deltaproteobacteria bacterium]
MKIGERGQVTIPKAIREKYGLLPQIEVDFLLKETGILIRKKTHHVSPVEQVYGILGKNVQTDPYIESIRGR